MATTIRSWLSRTFRVGAGTPYSLTMPAADGAGALTSDGAGVLSFTAAAGDLDAINADTTQTGTDANTSEKTLRSFSVVGNTLDANNETLHAVFFGTRIGSANSDVLRLKFGATTLITITLDQAVKTAFWIEVIIIRTGAATQKAIAFCAGERSDSNAPAEYTTPAETLSGAVALTLTGQNGAALANSLVYEGSKIWRINAP